MAPAQSLPPETLTQILEHAQNDRQTIYNACLVCRGWRGPSQRVLFAHVELIKPDWAAPDLNEDERAKRWLASPARLEYPLRTIAFRTTDKLGERLASASAGATKLKICGGERTDWRVLDSPGFDDVRSLEIGTQRFSRRGGEASSNSARTCRTFLFTLESIIINLVAPYEIASKFARTLHHLLASQATTLTSLTISTFTQYWTLDRFLEDFQTSDLFASTPFPFPHLRHLTLNAIFYDDDPLRILLGQCLALTHLRVYLHRKSLFEMPSFEQHTELEQVTIVFTSSVHLNRATSLIIGLYPEGVPPTLDTLVIECEDPTLIPTLRGSSSMVRLEQEWAQNEVEVNLTPM
ncbi:hypothetical protein RQP46_001325 [Phenoliferia psychrophenolica]